MRLQNKAQTRVDTLGDTWPALVDVIMATLMILLLFMIIQYIMFFLSDAIKRLDIKERQERLEQMISEMENKGSIPEGSINCETTGESQKLRFSSALLFPVGKATIPKERFESTRFLDALGEMLNDAFYRKALFDQIYIEGHTDTTPIHNRAFASNWELSTARAVYITKYFIDNGYLRPVLSKKRFLGAAGYSKFNYINSVADKETNRRIEILLVYAER